MKLKLIKALWGMTGSLEEQFKVISEAGYTGIEAPIPSEDQEARYRLENLEFAISRTIHVHTRVGYAEGPQVVDPRAPEYERELEVHEGWWDKIYQAKASQGESFLTMTPEFGPPGYMHTLPFTNQPVANLWDICLWMKQRLETKYKGYSKFV